MFRPFSSAIRLISSALSHQPFPNVFHRSLTGSIPTNKSIQEAMNKEKVPSVDSPTGDVHNTSKAVNDAKKWAEGVAKNNEGNVNVETSSGGQMQRSERNQQAPFPGSSMDLFRQFRPPSISSIMQPFRSFMPRSVRRQLRSIDDWMNQSMIPFVQGQGEDQTTESDLRDLWYDFDQELARPVTLTLDEKDNEYIAKLELKGFEKKDLSIRVQDDFLIIGGSINKAEEKDRKDRGKMHRSASSSFTRVLQLPDHVDKDKINAKYEGNVLILTIPKDKQRMEHGRIHIE